MQAVDIALTRQEHIMTSAALDDNRIKALLKETLVELLQERREDFRDLLTEVVEGLALVRAIDDGADTAMVGRDDVMQVLGGQP